MDKTRWEKEIERKYKIIDPLDIEKIRDRLSKLGFRKVFYAKQTDKTLDFECFKMREKGLVFRIRVNSYYFGKGPKWSMTLKYLQKKDGAHLNKELESSNKNKKNIVQIVQILQDISKQSIDWRKVIDGDREYLQSVGLVELRMRMDKKREQWCSNDSKAYLAFDELPTPLGFFVELEVSTSVGELEDLEKKLGLTTLDIEVKNYGELVKEIGGSRLLIFSD